MIIGLPLPAFTLFHVILSLVGIFTGFIVLIGMIKRQTFRGWNALFLFTTAATSATEFLFPGTGFDPARIVGVLSLAILVIAFYAFYGKHLIGRWSVVYAFFASMALYLNVFVGVVQAFQKLPLLAAQAPTQTEPPFLIAQGAVLACFGFLTVLAARRFRPA